MLGYERLLDVDKDLVECIEECKFKGDYTFCYLNFPECPIFKYKLAEKCK